VAIAAQATRRDAGCDDSWVARSVESWTDDLALALELGAQAAAVSLRELDESLQVQTKSDGTHR